MVDCVCILLLQIMVGKPGQCVFLQTTVSVSFPIQLFPPCNGTGFEQDLWRVVVPSPHVTEHALKWVHTLQRPSTKKIVQNWIKLKLLIFFSFNFFVICVIQMYMYIGEENINLKMSLLISTDLNGSYYCIHIYKMFLHWYLYCNKKVKKKQFFIYNNVIS